MTDAPRETNRWYHSVWFVLLMLTPFTLGPLALPLLWKSPRFSRSAKWWLTMATLVSFVWIIIAMIDVFKAYINQYRNLF